MLILILAAHTTRVVFRNGFCRNRAFRADEIEIANSNIR